MIAIRITLDDRCCPYCGGRDMHGDHQITCMACGGVRSVVAEPIRTMDDVIEALLASPGIARPPIPPGVLRQADEIATIIDTFPDAILVEERGLKGR